MKKLLTSVFMLAATSLFVFFAAPAYAQVENPQSDSAGFSGTVPTEPPQTAATISFPSNGQVFTDTPIDVTGVCQTDLVVKIFKNEVFAGSTTCTNGSFTVTVDLFTGTNELVARVYDALDQAGPDSNKPTVTFDNGTGPERDIDRVVITTNFAKKGANPGGILKWPFVITGGFSPYAVSIDWGDGNEDLFTRETAGEFIADHVYEKPGTYRVIVKVTDSEGTSTFLQVIGVANGPVLSRVDIDENSSSVRTRVIDRIIIWPLYVMMGLIVSTFWIGRRYELKKIKKKMASGSRF